MQLSLIAPVAYLSIFSKLAICYSSNQHPVKSFVQNWNLWLCLEPRQECAIIPVIPIVPVGYDGEYNPKGKLLIRPILPKTGKQYLDLFSRWWLNSHYIFQQNKIISGGLTSRLVWYVLSQSVCPNKEQFAKFSTFWSKWEGNCPPPPPPTAVLIVLGFWRVFNAVLYCALEKGIWYPIQCFDWNQYPEGVALMKQSFHFSFFIVNTAYCITKCSINWETQNIYLNNKTTAPIKQQLSKVYLLFSIVIWKWSNYCSRAVAPPEKKHWEMTSSFMTSLQKATNKWIMFSSN